MQLQGLWFSWGKVDAHFWGFLLWIYISSAIAGSKKHEDT
jgi:hypothetical protein